MEVNYVGKSSLLLSFLEAAPEISNTKSRKFAEAVESAEPAAMLVLVY
jgi:hypothetical protein